MGATEKSGKISGADGGVTGARTASVSETVTGICVVWETSPFEAVTVSVYVPVDGAASAVTVRVEDALPLAGIATGVGRVTVTPVGAGLDQAAERLTVEPNPPMEERRIVDEPDIPGVKAITAEDG